MFMQEVTIFDLLHESPCMLVTEEQMLGLVKEVANHDELEITVSKGNEGRFVVELWHVDEA